MLSRELAFRAMLDRGAEDIEIKRPMPLEDGTYADPATIGTRQLRVQRVEADPTLVVTQGGSYIAATMRVYAARDCDILEKDIFDRDGSTWTVGPVVALRDHGEAYGIVALAKP